MENSRAINKKATEVAADLENRHSTGCPYGVGSRQMVPCTVQLWMTGSGRNILLWKENTAVADSLIPSEYSSQFLDDYSISYPTEIVKILR